MKRSIAWVLGAIAIAIAVPLTAGASQAVNGIIIGNGCALNGIIIGNGRGLGTNEGATGMTLYGVHVEGGRLVR